MVPPVHTKVKYHFCYMAGPIMPIANRRSSDPNPKLERSPARRPTKPRGNDRQRGWSTEHAKARTLVSVSPEGEPTEGMAKTLRPPAPKEETRGRNASARRGKEKTAGPPPYHTVCTKARAPRRPRGPVSAGTAADHAPGKPPNRQHPLPAGVHTIAQPTEFRTPTPPYPPRTRGPSVDLG